MNSINQPITIEQSKNKIYLDLWNEAKGRDYTIFFNELERDFGVEITKDLINFTDNLALKTQITIKRSKPLYLHGYLLYSALTNYLNKQNEHNEQNDEINILETGTARGFSAIMMAKAVDDYLKKQAQEHQPQQAQQPHQAEEAQEAHQAIRSNIKHKKQKKQKKEPRNQ